MQELGSAIQQTRAWACYDCGKCTATCPIARVGGAQSPRRHVMAVNLRKEQDLLEDKTLFSCLTCALCDERCPAQVAYTDLVLKLRLMARSKGVEPDCPHGGALHSLMRMMARGGMKQDRLQWLTEDLETSPEKGDVFYWTGCTMYFDALFTEFQVQTLNGTRSALSLLNRLGISPVVSRDERCCGHDLLWNGDYGNFELLAKHNTDLVARSGAGLLLTSCAECARTWRLAYEPFFKSVVNHVELSMPLPADPDAASAVLANGIRAGSVFISMGDTRLARNFVLQLAVPGGSRFGIGSYVNWEPGLYLRGGFWGGPNKGVLYRVVRDGEPAAWIKGPQLTWVVAAPGAYRVEAYRYTLRIGPLVWNLRPWIFANPFRVTPPQGD